MTFAKALTRLKAGAAMSHGGTNLYYTLEAVNGRPVLYSHLLTTDAMVRVYARLEGRELLRSDWHTVKGHDEALQAHRERIESMRKE